MHVSRFTSLVAAVGAFTAAAVAAPTLSLPAPAPGTTTTTPNKASNQPWFSTDGRYLTFASNASNLIAGFTDNNEASQSGGASDLYQRDLQTGTITLITHAAGSTTSGMNSRTTGQMRASDDGRYVFFMSDSTDLVTGRGGSQRGYVWDRNTGSSTLCVDQQCGGGTLSADGNWIAVYITTGGGHTMPKNVFDSSQGTYPSTTRYAGYLINRASGAVTLMTHQAGSPGTVAAADVQNVALSADGRYCAFESAPVTGWDTYTGTFVTNSEALYVYDRQNDAMTLVTKTNSGAAPSVQVLNPTPQSISADGRYVYFSHGTDLNFGGAASADSNGINDTYRYDRDAAADSRVVRLFFDAFALNPNAIANQVFSSPNNRYLVFLSTATNLVTGDTNGRSDVFRYDATAGTVERVNVNSNGSEWTTTANGTFANSFARVDDSGNVTFVSNATGLGFTDTNAAVDIFLATFSAPATAPTVASPSKASIATTSATLGGNITADGGASITERGVVYAVTSTNNNPQIGGTGVTKVSASGTSTGAFTATATGLAAGTGYTFKAYATNSAGTGYSSADTFTTTAADTTPPTVVSIVRQSPAAQTIADGTTSFTFRVTYSEAVQGVATTQFQVEAVNGSNAAGTVDAVSGTGATRDVTVTLTSGFGEFRLKPVN